MAIILKLSALLRRLVQALLIMLGKVPVHVAFVMDGNRRYAERQHLDNRTGHTHGYGKMVEVIHWCMELGIKHITVYAFSIDNFKRSTGEVSTLMRLAEDKYVELAKDNGLAKRESITMRIVGDLELAPSAVQGAAARLMCGTAALPRQLATLHVCFSYTASEESVFAVQAIQSAIRESTLQPLDVCPAALHGALRTGPSCPPVDLLIRTSGETRLSDFLLWQAAHAHLCYLPTLWPELSYCGFIQCVMSYQHHMRTLLRLRRHVDSSLAWRATHQEQPQEEHEEKTSNWEEDRGNVEDRGQWHRAAHERAGSDRKAAGGATGGDINEGTQGANPAAGLSLGMHQADYANQRKDMKGPVGRGPPQGGCSASSELHEEGKGPSHDGVHNRAQGATAASSDASMEVEDLRSGPGGIRRRGTRCTTRCVDKQLSSGGVGGGNNPQVETEDVDCKRDHGQRTTACRTCAGKRSRGSWPLFGSWGWMGVGMLWRQEASRLWLAHWDAFVEDKVNSGRRTGWLHGWWLWKRNGIWVACRQVSGGGPGSGCRAPGRDLRVQRFLERMKLVQEAWAEEHAHL